MDIELPYMAEYAKSGRAICKGCKCSIPKDNLRIAVMIQFIQMVKPTHQAPLLPKVRNYHAWRSLYSCRGL
ncbi:poly [ADP-ribose] polymerase isoform X6 [Drosophila biarmipes]|uniref:poly [ADP-ribose] polymerase isoform X6 n=1 Tax=Drosophila biarmipes TaxID=125945 RepID=UPI0021CCCD0F|nr:poly [ADP-ribose] polymerase isoform X6 [Drosophila biarmipes]